MEIIKNFKKHLSKLALCLAVTLLIQCQPARSENTNTPRPEPGKQTIMLALLLDTSNSMDGLIDQAKSQLWKIVNELAEAKCDDGSKPAIKIALYEYGNDRLSERTGYIRQVSALTDDLDLISEKLFSLTTNGGQEYCGHVIQTSLQQLAWATSEADLKMIFIAGNEPFTQGSVPYSKSCALAMEKAVVINTIYCGNFDEGMGSGWKRGADLTGGSYMSIDQNRKTVYVPTPYDEQIDALNDRLNSTYVYYGSSGKFKKENQVTQDSNASFYGKSNKVERAVSKSSHAYSNSSWDLVDATKDDEKVIEKAPSATLPEEMKSMTLEQRKTYIKQKSDERVAIQTEIQKLNAKRTVYQEQNKPSDSSHTSLDGTMMKSVKEHGKTRKLSWQK